MTDVGVGSGDLFGTTQRWKTVGMKCVLFTVGKLRTASLRWGCWVKLLKSFGTARLLFLLRTFAAAPDNFLIPGVSAFQALSIAKVFLMAIASHAERQR